MGATCPASAARLQGKHDSKQDCYVGGDGSHMHQLLLPQAEQLWLRAVHGRQLGSNDGGELSHNGRVRDCTPGGQAGRVLQKLVSTIVQEMVGKNSARVAVCPPCIVFVLHLVRIEMLRIL